jgi:hypothetical protein
MSSTSDNASEELPEIDERLVAPESRYEIDDGKLVYVSPADPPHALCHMNLAALLRAHVAPDFLGAVDMLTRTSKIDDIAPDASVFPRAPDPRTGGRQLEHLAFEIASTESLGHSGRKAAKLIGRGVRRVFAIDVERSRVLEWSRALASWSILDLGAHIEDPALAVPLPVDALVESSKTDDAIARALVARQHPVIEAAKAIAKDEGWREGRNEGRREGRNEGRREARGEGAVKIVLAVLESRGLSPTPQQRDAILGERDAARVERWIARVALCASVAELLDA